MARTKRNRNKKQKYLGETKRKGRGLFDSKFFTMLLSENAKAKAKYEKRLNDAYALNQQLLAEQQEALIKLEKQGVDGPHNRTRSKTKMAKGKLFFKISTKNALFHVRRLNGAFLKTIKKVIMVVNMYENV